MGKPRAGAKRPGATVAGRKKMAKTTTATRTAVMQKTKVQLLQEMKEKDPEMYKTYMKKKKISISIVVGGAVLIGIIMILISLKISGRI